eukprot:5509684-Amphidinium_carterae.1
MNIHITNVTSAPGASTCVSFRLEQFARAQNSTHDDGPVNTSIQFLRDSPYHHGCLFGPGAHRVQL